MSTSFIKTQDFVLNYLNSFEKFDAATKNKWQDIFTAIFNCENSEEALTLITQAGGNVVRPQNPNSLAYTALKKGAFVFWEGDGGQSLIGLVTKQPINESDKARVIVFTPNTMFFCFSGLIACGVGLAHSPKNTAKKQSLLQKHGFLLSLSFNIQTI